VAAWLPWVIVTATSFVEGNILNTDSVRLLLTPASISVPFLNSTIGPQGALFVWSVLTVLGIPLAALAWMRVSRPITWLIVCGYGLWLMVTLIFSIISAQYLLLSNRFSVQVQGHPIRFARTGGLDPQIGLWLSMIALVICLVGLWLLISAARRVAPSTEASGATVRPVAQTPGAGTLTFGLVLWAIGFLWLAWASLGCPEFVLVSATCQGLSSDSAMTYVISRFASQFGSQFVFQFGSAFGVNPQPVSALIAIDPQVGEYAISILLTVGALFIGVGVWRRGVSAALCSWATAWLVAAAAFAALAWYGISLVVNDPFLQDAPGVSWRGESGILFTAGALLVCLVGIGLLWFALLFHRTQTSGV